MLIDQRWIQLGHKHHKVLVGKGRKPWNKKQASTEETQVRINYQPFLRVLS